MPYNIAAACIVLVYASQLSCHAQGASEMVCIDQAAMRQRLTTDSDTVSRPLLQAFNATQEQADKQMAAYRTYLALGDVCEFQHRFTDAEQYYQSAYTLARSAFGERSDSVVVALHGVGAMRLAVGRTGEADVVFHQLLNVLESDPNANPLDIAAVLNSRAVVQQMNGNVSKAAALMRKVVRIVESNPGANAVDVGTALSNLATMLRSVGNRSEAVVSAERARSVLECCKNTVHYAANLVIRGLLHLDSGDLATAEHMLLQALSISEGSSQQGSPDVGAILTHLGVFYAHSRRDRDAESYFQRAVEVNRRLLGADHPRLLESMGAYAAFLRETKRKREAKKLEAYIDDRRKKYRAANPELANVVDVHSLMNQSRH